jgi:hypothetical protein
MIVSMFRESMPQRTSPALALETANPGPASLIGYALKDVASKVTRVPVSLPGWLFGAANLKEEALDCVHAAKANTKVMLDLPKA